MFEAARRLPYLGGGGLTLAGWTHVGSSTCSGSGPSGGHHWVIIHHITRPML